MEFLSNKKGRKPIKGFDDVIPTKDKPTGISALTITSPKHNESIGDEDVYWAGTGGTPGKAVYIERSIDPGIWHWAADVDPSGNWSGKIDGFPHPALTIRARHLGSDEFSNSVTYSVYASPPVIYTPINEAPFFDRYQQFAGKALANSIIEIEAFHEHTPNQVHLGSGVTNSGEWGLDWRIVTNWSLSRGIYTLKIRQTWGEFGEYISDWTQSTHPAYFP